MHVTDGRHWEGTVAPQEYGIERSEKEIIGLLTSLPLLEQIVRNLEDTKKVENPSANFYFTKESHMCVLVVSCSHQGAD